MKRYRNSEILREIEEKVHSLQGREALRMKYVDGLTLMQIAETLDIPYPTLVDRYYHKWQPELFAEFDPE